ncbi:polyprenyl synthetase family protein [Rhizobium grahamii]|uniref:Probable farnesyl diphosphate synthase n=1 Tax=Rhizobium grahamii TaxID=1120045 RepID=A0A5Q0CCB8_9HYPH|nr:MULTISPECIES: farnesyl diphosphate synthase [Rhizobium]QFY61730.1 polyprenyl synthetase family protein [Rhizobium grahamii]QRM49106.1 polyprenyl synthetase family protein [Rhizobium sp. BG6]
MSANIDTFENRLSSNATAIEALLDKLLSSEVLSDEITRPERLRAAMHYAVLNGGKRLRPFLVVEATALFGGDREAALRVGAALECVHCYSLVHDDLPAMDDDDLRRGKPTAHIAFDEATAILAGDSLLTYAFDIIASTQGALAESSKVALVLALSRAAGVGGMAGGQALDLAAEKQSPDEQGIVTLQAMKTGALIRFACEAGAIIAGTPANDRARLRLFGEKIGLAFQLADDVLDLTADAATMGKATGKDASRGKGTLVGLRGLAWVEATLNRLVCEAEELLAPYGERGKVLADAARFVANRKS